MCIVKPLRIRRFAGARDQLAKTDKLDAQLIADFAATVRPEVTPSKSKNLLLIKDLIARRRQLISMRTQELNRIQIMGKQLESSCRRLIRELDKEIKRIERRLATLVEAESEWSEKQAFL